MKQIERICQMEKLFDFALQAIKEFPLNDEQYQQTKQAIDTLSAYYSSDEWKQDFAADETGLLPKNIKRGVLSEDGLWNLLSEWKELKK